MYNRLAAVFAFLIVAAMVAAPVSYKLWHDRQYRNFHVVESNVLYRSAQLPLARLEQVVYDHQIRTIVSLREEGKDAADQSEEIWAKAMGLKFVRIPPQPWFPDKNGNIPAEAGSKVFLDIMRDPRNHPVLVHCYAGIHRTGMMCALFRLEHGWTNLEAEAEMRLMGYSVLDDHDDVLGYLATYRPPHPVAKTVQALPVVRRP